MNPTMKDSSFSSLSFTSYFQTVFNSLFLLLLCPFWVSFSKEDDTFHFKESRLHKVSWYSSIDVLSHARVIFCFLFQSVQMICLLVHGILWIAAFPTIRGHAYQKATDNPMIFFHIFSSVVWVSYSFALTFLFWRKRSSVMKLFTNAPFQQPNNTKVSNYEMFPSL
jgi:hypothetical protein